ncbi:MAG: hypothetical protein RLZZ300_2619 [Pseudomonadota bacterium]
MLAWRPCSFIGTSFAGLSTTTVISEFAGAWPGNWLPTGAGDKDFQLILRLYNSTPETLANLETIPLPSIKRVGECS